MDRILDFGIAEQRLQLTACYWLFCRFWASPSADSLPVLPVIVGGAAIGFGIALLICGINGYAFAQMRQDR
jgi:hypothetical protein